MKRQTARCPSRARQEAELVSAPSRSRLRRFDACARAGFLIVMIVLWLAGAAAAQTVWELEPYRMGVLLIVDRSPVMAAIDRSQLSLETQRKLEAVAGAALELSTLEAELSFETRLIDLLKAAYPPETFAAELPEEWKPLDKVVVVAMAERASGLGLMAREYDVRVDAWSAAAAEWIAQPGQLSSATAAMVLEVFSPLAEVEAQGTKAAKLRLRGGQLPWPDRSLPSIQPGDLFQPFIRTSHRDGTTRRVQSVPFTFLTVTARAAGIVDAELHTGMRNPLGVRRQRGRYEPLALRVRATSHPTRFRLQSRTEPKRYLPGYEVFVLSDTPGKSERLGLTDVDGSLLIAPGGDPFRRLVVKHGQLLMARVPLVPGLRASETVPIPDDDYRLEIEGQIVGLQEDLVDHVARRAALVIQARARLADGRLDQAKRIYDHLEELPHREEFASRLRQLRVRIDAANLSDPQTKARIAQLVNDTEKILNQRIGEAELLEIEQELKSEKAEPVPEPSKKAPVDDVHASSTRPTGGVQMQSARA